VAALCTTELLDATTSYLQHGHLRVGANDLYEKFFEKNELKLMRDALDCSVDSDEVNQTVIGEDPRFTDYLNFFEYIAYVPGRLYDFGDYPGAILDPSSETSICGELVALPPDQTLIDELDKYEEFDPSNPEASLFIRKRTKVMLANGESLEAWIYVYNRDPGDAPIVRGGDYSKSKVA
jgi:gamma-glutamylcyclotransferase (GGCT)/AIG2-like uncharacterized protein YtfP